MILYEHLRNMDHDKMAIAFATAVARIAQEPEAVDKTFRANYPVLDTLLEACRIYYEKANASPEQVQDIYRGASLAVFAIIKCAEDEILKFTVSDTEPSA